MSANVNLNTKTLVAIVPAIGHKLGKYIGFLFFLLLAAVYGFVILQINLLSSSQPDSSQVMSAKVPSPRVDTNVAQRLETLKDNSVNVQTVYNNTRNNPFSE